MEGIRRDVSVSDFMKVAPALNAFKSCKHWPS
jgi:hypothetical protein